MGEHAKQLRQWVAGRPKGLVQIRVGLDIRPILAYQAMQLQEAGIDASQIYIQTNGRYYDQFCAEASLLGIAKDHVFTNGVMQKEDRLGPLGDLHFAVERIGCTEPLLVMASDTLVLNDQKELQVLYQFVQEYASDGNSRIIVYEGHPSRLRQHGLVEVSDNVICGFQEKPQDPEPVRSNLINASIHLYSPEILLKIHGLHEQYGTNERLNIVQLLYKNHVIKVMRVASRVDIGTIEDVLGMNVEVVA